MEGIKKVFTTELEPYVSELKEVMLKKGYSNCQIQTYSKIWNNMISYATNQPEQEFLQATVDFALSRDDLKDEFAEYLKEVTKNL